MVILKWFGITSAGLFVVFSVWYLLQPSMKDVGIRYAEKSTGNTQSITVKWFGITTLLIDDGDTQLLIDGYFSRPGLLDILLKKPISSEIDTITQVLNQHKINRLAVVIPVHSHFDHAMDSAEVAKQTGAILLGSTSTAYIGRSSNLAEAQIKIAEVGEPVIFGQFSVTLFPSEHAPLATNSSIDGIISQPFELPAPYTAWQLGKAYSIVIKHPKGSMLVQGSAGFVPNALKQTKVDAVFLGTGGLNTLSSDYQQQYIFEMVKKTEPNTVYIVHHDNLFGELGNIEQSKLMPTFDSNLAFNLSQWVIPAQLMQLKYAEPVSIHQF